MSFDNVYEAITSENDASRWAFGTGFEDPLSGVDTTVPAGVDADELATYCLMLGDDALIMSHRLQEWCTRAPELEDEVAIANIALDLLGQARLLLARASAAAPVSGEWCPSTISHSRLVHRGEGDRLTEDDLAFRRGEHEFRNVRLAEVVNGDFAHTMARLLVFSAWRLALMARLMDNPDPVLSAIAGKAVKELTYHRDYAARWVLRLGDGTELSHERMQAGLDAVWPLVDELFLPDGVSERIGVDPATLREEFDAVLAQVLPAATLQPPQEKPLPGVAGKYGRHGVHTEAMGYLLAELQSVARAYEGATW
jgi:ring-1,2-phenylacetyl-CoA epoxidase subunit PaaC